MFKRTLGNIAERDFLGKLLKIIDPPQRISTIEWAEKYRVMASTESYISGNFDCSRTPAFEYLYRLCDEGYIHIIGCMKASQVGASELENNIIGKRQDTNPCNMVVFFPGTNLLKEYSRKRLKPFFDNCNRLRAKVNIGIPKPSHDFFSFPGGSIALRTLGSIQSVLSSAFPFIVLEEFAQVKAEVAKQGDTLGLCIGRQKSFPIGMKKILAFSTPTFGDFCNMEKLYNKGFQLIFKAECHSCKELIELSGWTMDDFIHYDEYPERYIDPEYGKDNPDSAYFACTKCHTPWTFEEKVKNIIAGKRYGFIDDCGNFSLGWHPRKEERPIMTIEEYYNQVDKIDKDSLRQHLRENKISLIYTLQYPEILSCFEATSNAVLLASKKILAQQALLKGDETLSKDYYNNSRGLPYSSGVSSMEADEMKTYRLNYPEGIVPMEGLVLTAGIDVQDNRLAYVIVAFGRNDNMYLVKWEEIYGDVTNSNDSVWQQMKDICLSDVPHIGGKTLKIAAVSIDSGDNTEVVYRWVQDMNFYNPQVFATKGVRDLRFSEDEIYQEPREFDMMESEKRQRRTLAETMGVVVYQLGSHRAHGEILRKISLNKNRDNRSDVFFFNEQSYGQFEEQMTSCRKIIDQSSAYSKPIYKLIPGKRKEAMDACKNALHAGYAIGIRNYSHVHFKKIEEYLYE